MLSVPQCLAVAVALAACCVAPSPAMADAPPVIVTRLEYVRGPGAQACPDERFFRDVVAGHLGGRDPFDPTGTDKVKLTVRRAGGIFEATLEMFDAADNPRGHSTPLRDASCVEVIETMGAVVVPWVMPLGPPPEPKAPPPAPRVAPPPSCPPSHDSHPDPCPPATRFDLWPERWPLPPIRPPEPDPPKPLDRYLIALRLGFVPRVEWVVSGSGSLGFSGEFGVRYHAVSLDFEMHGDPSIGTQSVASGSVGFSLLTGALLLCGSYEWFEGCGVAEVGRLSFAEPFRGMPPSAPYGAAGFRAAMNIPIAPPRLFLHAALDVLAPIHPASYASRNDVFQVAGTAAGIGIGLLAEISP